MDIGAVAVAVDENLAERFARLGVAHGEGCDGRGRAGWGLQGASEVGGGLGAKVGGCMNAKGFGMHA